MASINDILTLDLAHSPSNSSNASFIADESTKQNKNDVDTITNPELSTFLVYGYMRVFNNDYNISDIINLCHAFYGQYYQYLISYNPNNQWFTSIKDSIDVIKYTELNPIPLNQYIDDRYQIIKGAITGFQQILWKGFLCIDTKTNEIHRLKLILGKNNELRLYISEPLTVRTIKYDTDGNKYANVPRWNTEQGWLSPKYDKYSVNSFVNPLVFRNLSGKNQVIFEDGDLKLKREDELSYSFFIWKEFEQNLWNLFIAKRIYDENEKNIKKHQIWKIIQFLSILYFEGYHDLKLKIPQIILMPDDKPSNFFIYHDVFDEKETIPKNTDDYKDFDFEKDLYAKIIEYEYGANLECQCFLYIDFGGGYWVCGGCNQKLICVTFKMHKSNQQIKTSIKFDVVTTYQCYGIGVS